MAVYIVGDIHGHLDKLRALLQGAGLVDDRLQWSGDAARLWFVGDFFDRGPAGLGVVDLIMRLQGQAVAAGGEVHALLGNHEVLFLSAHRFRNIKRFMLNWKRNGGQESDMGLVTARHIAWLRNLPPVALAEDRLLIHADAMLYFEYGSTISEVTESFRQILHSDEHDEWDYLLESFAERMAFSASRSNGSANAAEMLYRYGGQQIIHGHTPIQYITDHLIPTEPFVYAHDLCVNVDGGMYLGAPGFLYRLPE